MHLRTPIVIGIVAVAAVAAGVRGLRDTGIARPALTVAAAGTAASATGYALPFAVSGAAAQTASRRGQHHAATSPARITVYVAGEVLHGGIYTLASTARAADALHAAGGPTTAADLVAVNLAAPLHDGEEVALFPKTTAEFSSALRSHAARSHRASTSEARARRAARNGIDPPRTRHKKKRRSGRTGAGTGADGVSESFPDAPSEVVDLNSADASELETLPGIGAALASRIVDFRERTGRFATMDDLLDVGGMTETKLDAVSPYVTVR